MSVMTWNRKMSVGLDELDSDHKELIRIINQLGAGSADEARRAAVRQSLVALQRYAEYHFAREESVMRACGYPELDEHQDQHRNFIQRIQGLTRRFDADPEAATATRRAFLDTHQEAGSLLLGTHFPPPTGGFVRGSGPARRFVPPEAD